MLKTGPQMLLTLLKLSGLELVRSVSLKRNLLSAILVFIIVAYVALQLIGLAVFMGPILRNFFQIQDIPAFLSKAAIFYLLLEFIARFFIQKPPLLDLRKYLHLPIRRSAIIQYLFARSLVSVFSFIVVILFLPITITDISPQVGQFYSTCWLGTLCLLSLSLHFIVLLIKRSPHGGLVKGVLIAALPAVPILLLYFGLFNLGEYTGPFFYLTFSSPLPILVSAAVCGLLAIAAYRKYYRNAYPEPPAASSAARPFFLGGGLRLLSGFGLPGIIAETELKLVLRHKKSRGYLFLCVIALLYGVLIYGSGDNTFTGGSYLYLFVGTIITGAFLLQYGQLLISWNSASFDFYQARENGLYALLKGKFILLTGTMVAAYLLTIPYIYFGWQVMAFHTAALFYNAGIGVHVIIYLSLWEPKPMDINKGASFNYEGLGMAQFLMVFPYMLIMYGLYFLFDVILGSYTALLLLSCCGLAGLLFYEKLLMISVRKLHRQRHAVSTSFRQEL